MFHQPQLIVLEGERQKRWRKAKRWWRQLWKPNKMVCPCVNSRNGAAFLVIISVLNTLFIVASWLLGWPGMFWVVVSTAVVSMVIVGTVVFMVKTGVLDRPHHPNCHYQRSGSQSSRR